MIGEGYAAIPTWMLRDETISAPALLAYAALASRAGFESNHPGQETIAKEARCGIRRISDALRELEERGLIDRIERRYSSGARASDGYVLHSGKRPEPVIQLPANSAGSDQPADSDTTNLQNRASAPSIEITKEDITNVEPDRPDVFRLLDLLDEEIRKNGARKLPTRSAGNLNAMRLLLDRDGYSEEEIADVIRWCQADQFWHTNILSAAKLRDKFERLASQKRAKDGRNGPSSPASRVLGIDLGASTGGAIPSREIGREAAPSILGEIEGGRW